MLGENRDHVALLSEVRTGLPPILVHRGSMRVIDGMHRLQAALAGGADEVDAIFFDGDDAEAFIVGVRANVAHGLPLSLRERKAAAGRILRERPEWSDRRIAHAAGLSPKTVGALRRCSSEELPQSDKRVSRDGRVRPLDPSAGRRLAAEIFTANPRAVIRAVASAVGLSPSTVSDVRDRILNGEDPVGGRGSAAPSGRAVAARTASHPVVSPIAVEDQVGILRGLRADPSLRLKEAGRTVLRWLDSHNVTANEIRLVAERIPPHSTVSVARLARINAQCWSEFARQLEQRA